MRVLLALMMLAGAVAMPVWVRAKPASLTVTLGDTTRSYSAAELLARPDASEITIPDDASYGRSMTYRAVPLLALLGFSIDPAFGTLEARATDGFVAQIPLSLVARGAGGGSVAWIAVEDGAAPWPALKGKSVGAGPFYLVWEHPERSNVQSEQWPYQLAAITATESPAHRWPQMTVGAEVAGDAPARRGQAVFATQCLPCHRMKGAGAADVGPDLGTPMSPTQYMSADGLRRLIRNPKAVRTWPQQQMPGFDAQTLPDADLDALIAYLAYMARTPR
jgi:mono/diheme cytochrome c family protein